MGLLLALILFLAHLSPLIPSKTPQLPDASAEGTYILEGEN